MSDTPNDKHDESDKQNGVDGDGSSIESSRARTQEELAAAELARRVENESQKAPAATIHEIILAHPGVRAMVVATAIRALTAKKFYFDKLKKCMVHEEDSMTQMKAVAFLAAYSDGLPAQTTVNMHFQPPGKNEMTPEEMMSASPAVLEAMERAIARARAKLEKRVEPI